MKQLHGECSRGGDPSRRSFNLPSPLHQRNNININTSSFLKSSPSSFKMSDSPDEVESAFPIPCAFCRIASAYPASTSSTSASKCDAIPLEDNSDSQKVSPSCFLILNTPEVMAFLDIMPITPGHMLLATREHRRRIGEVGSEEGREIGTFGFIYCLNRRFLFVSPSTHWEVRRSFSSCFHVCHFHHFYTCETGTHFTQGDSISQQNQLQIY